MFIILYIKLKYISIIKRKIVKFMHVNVKQINSQSNT